MFLHLFLVFCSHCCGIFLNLADKSEKKSVKSVGPKPNFRDKKPRKTGLTTVELQNIFPELNEPVPDEGTFTKRYNCHI